MPKATLQIVHILEQNVSCLFKKAFRECYILGSKDCACTGHLFTAGRDGFECCTIQSVDNLEMTELRLMRMWPCARGSLASAF